MSESGRLQEPLEILIVRRKLFPYEPWRMSVRRAYQQFDEEHSKSFSFEVPRIRFGDDHILR